MGKSALTWHWVNESASEKIPDLAGVIWWSFYEDDGSMENFIRHALAYITDQTIEDVDQIKRDDRIPRLLQALKEKPYLLVLDGIERIMVAYHRMDAPKRQQSDLGAGGNPGRTGSVQVRQQ
jgi:hypothetical protein